MKIKTALVLVGGLGTRLRAVTQDKLPKPMVEVNKLPFLEHLVLRLKACGISEIIFATGHMHEKIENYFGDGSKFDIKIKYSRELEPLGTGGALKLAQKFITEKFLMVNGDTYFDGDLDLIEQVHETSKGTCTLTLTPKKITKDFGLVITADNKVMRFLEKGNSIPNENKISVGYYILEPEIFNYLPDGKSSIEREVFPKLAEAGKLFAVSVAGRHVDIGTPEGYEEFKRYVSNKSVSP